LRGLVFGLSALGVKAAALAWVYLSYPVDLEQDDFASTMATTMRVMEVFGFASTCVALVGIGYSAIAAHRGEWGVVLVLAWISSLAGVFYELGSFAYATF
jgi:hypothetical protein